MELDRIAVIEAGGHRLEVVRIAAAGAGSPVLVFLHEGLGSVRMWRSFPEELCARTGCGGVVYSRYGHGFSDRLTANRNVEYMHDEARSALPELLAALQVTDAVLVGHSDGASIALIYAARPTVKVRGLVLEAPHVFVEQRSIEGIAAAKAAYENGDLAARLAQYHADAQRTFYGWNDIWLDPSFRSWNIWEMLPRVASPAFVFQGARDEYGTFAQVEALVEYCAGSVAALYLSKAGHGPHRDCPALVLDSAALFIRSLI